MSTATTPKLRSPLKWHGGKSYLARRFVALFPPHRVYVEPFIGGGSILLNKPPAEREVAGDLNAGLINLWQILAARPELILGALDRIPYEEASFQAALTETATNPRNAVSFLIRNRFSRGGMGKDFAWSDRLRGKKRPGGPVPGEINSWDTIRADLPRIAERIARVEFNCCDALQLIRSNDTADALIYCDPPYIPESRTVPKVYAHEMTRGDHVDLLALLLTCRGKVFVSGYSNPLYDGLLIGWTRHDFEMPNHSGQGKTKQRRIECLWESPSR